MSVSSLYEAAILGIAEFKKSGFAFGGISGATRMKIAVEPQAITHELAVAKVRRRRPGTRRSGMDHGLGFCGQSFLPMPARGPTSA
jgi:hypothetical protein